MLLAKLNDALTEAHPKSNALCPHCGGKVISKCGGSQLYQSSEAAKEHNHNIWHWAHESSCIYHTEPETEWHLKWKNYAKGMGCEIEKRFDNNIADIFIENKIIEVQHSPISYTEILSRNKYYQCRGFEINWVFDFTEKTDTLHLLNIIGNHSHYFRISYLPYYVKSLFDYIPPSEPIHEPLQKYCVQFSPLYGRVFLDLGDEKTVMYLYCLNKKTAHGFCTEIFKPQIFGTDVFMDKIYGSLNVGEEFGCRYRAHQRELFEFGDDM